MNRWPILAMTLVAWCGSIGLRADAQPLDAQPLDGEKQFEQHVRPLLVSQCVRCHGAEKQEGGLRLDSLQAMLDGGDSGPALAPGQPSESLIVDAVNHVSVEMPPAGKLSDAMIAELTLWVATGATWPQNLDRLRPEAMSISEDDRQWWAFRPLITPDVPSIESDAWSINEIDRFVHQRLADSSMTPAPRASKEHLIRRLYYDLIGIPPTPERVEAFINDDADDAWPRLVDTLLDDPRYGEHWGRFWLDLVRYAESDGWNQDAYRPHIYHYRDYVIRSFNDDKPYPDFVREQLAGDEITDGSPEALVATGYLRLGIYEYNQRDARSLWNDTINEITDVTADVFLGIGMACARCHDHKFDPILQRDYFALRAFFEPLIWRDDVPLADASQLTQYESAVAAWKATTAEVQQQIDALLKPYHDSKWASTVDKFPLDIQACYRKPENSRTSWEHQMAYLIGRQFHEEGGGPLSGMTKEDKATYEELQKRLAEFDAIKPQPPSPLMTAADFPGLVSPTIIPDSPDSEPISPGFPAVLGDEPIADKPPTADCMNSHGVATTGRRTELAQWIGRHDNPLTTRVIVNRIWQQHFGQGLVATASDFGRLGTPPTHPELLDWLAVTFVKDGWSFKKLHKRILTSATWQQSAIHLSADEYQSLDPAETLLWRFRVKRLSAEQIRDTALVASGELDPAIGGPSVEGDSPRRSIYVNFRRNTPDTFLQLFDSAGGLSSVTLRNRTTTPIQSLMMFNGDWMLQRAEKMAERLMSFADARDDRGVINQAFLLAWGRYPSDEESEQANRFVGTCGDKEKLIDLCHVLLNSSEFLYTD